MISCRELTRRFGDFTALDSLALDVAKGTICVFLGPNGAGKSTTVKILTGLLAPTSGDATVCGLSVKTDAAAIKQRIGVLPENLGLFDDLTVTEHLLLTGDVYGLPKNVTRERIDGLLRTLRLEEGRDRFASQCSHGMRKKTAFAMALLPNPEVLFLDEPFESIDPVTSKVMRDLLVEAAKRGITVFLTSHLLSVAERIGHQFVIIRAGQMVWNSRAEDLPCALEDLYHDLAEPAESEELEWLGSGQS